MVWGGRGQTTAAAAAAVINTDGHKTHSQLKKTKGHNIVRSKRGYLQSEVATACCGQRPEHCKVDQIKKSHSRQIIAAAAAAAAAALLLLPLLLWLLLLLLIPSQTR